MSVLIIDGDQQFAELTLEALAARLPSFVRLGTSSWTFPGWAGLVYQRRYRNQSVFARESLAEYATHPLFRTVGIDRSFYGPLREEELRRYASQLPPGFRWLAEQGNMEEAELLKTFNAGIGMVAVVPSDKRDAALAAFAAEGHAALEIGRISDAEGVTYQGKLL